MKVVIDRFEGAYAVCEKDDRSMVNIKRSELPVNAEEGDVIAINGGTVTIDSEETSKRKQQSRESMDEVFKQKLD